MNWYRGNTHSHSTLSDGTSTPEGVVEWYARQKYDWLALTDHWNCVGRDHARQLSEKFGILVIPGIELGGSTHVVGLGVDESLPFNAACESMRAVDSLGFGVDWINTHDGLPIMAHPTWTYMWDSQDALAIAGCSHFEVLNGSCDCNSFAAGGKKSTDDIWNEILNSGRLMYGIGSDDSHTHEPDAFIPEHYGGYAGTAWTLTAGETLSETGVLRALASGRFVASNGPRVFDFGVSANQYYVDINEPYEHYYYTTTFFGTQGILAEIHGSKPRYQIQGNEQWIRARCFCTSGRYLWTQPIFI